MSRWPTRRKRSTKEQASLTVREGRGGEDEASHGVGGRGWHG